MNPSFKLFSNSKYNPIENLYAPEKKNVLKSNPIHVKMDGFSHRVSQSAKPDTDDDANLETDFIFPDEIESKWNVHIPIKIKQWRIDEKGKQVHVEETRLIRLSVESDFDRPFPQSHKIVLMDPVDDIFFHWTLNLTPFTFQSMAQQMKWKFPPQAGDGFKETFRRFAALIQQCGNDVVRNTSSHYATIHIIPNQSLATLVFGQCVNGYRNIDFLALDFIESSWTDIKKDISEFSKSILKEHEEIKLNLIQVMEVISKYQPTLLMNCNELYKPIDTHQPSRWLEAKKRISNPYLDSFQERMVKTKKFLEEAEKLEVPSELVHIKSIFIPVHDKSDFDGKQTIATKELVFSFYYKKNLYNQMCYQITITDPSDLFFHFTSIDITPEVFHIMTESLHIKASQSKFASNVTISRASGSFTHNIDSQDRSMGAKRWFHDVTGNYGVVGVISGDFMTGVTQQPERYQAKLIINRLTEAELIALNDPRKPKKKDFSPLKKLEGEPRCQPALKAILKFSETLLFHRQTKLVIEFRETPIKELQSYIQRRYSQTKFQIAETQIKLDALLREANGRNLGLFSLLDRPNRNTRVESRPIPLVDDKHRFGFERRNRSFSPVRIRENNSTIKEKSFGLEESNIVNNQDNNLLGPDVRLIPQRSVASMKIPIFSTGKQEKNESRLYKPPSKIDPWYSNSITPPSPRSLTRGKSGLVRVIPRSTPFHQIRTLINSPKTPEDQVDTVQHAVVSAFDLFSVGVGPSSSHTVGPMRAAKIFVEDLVELGALDRVVHLRCDLYGSLAMTGVGHGTPNAVLMGLEGETPENVDPKSINGRVDTIYKTNALKLNGSLKIEFNPDKHLIFHFNQSLPQHPNGMRFSAYDKEGELLATNEFFSIGGGFVVNEKTQLVANAYYLDKRVDHVEKIKPTEETKEEAELMLQKATPALPNSSSTESVPSTRLEKKLITAALPFHNCESLVHICETKNVSIAQVVFQNELQWRSADEIAARTIHIWNVMNMSIQNGINAEEGYLPGGLRVKRRAPGIHAKLMKGLADYALGRNSPNQSVLKKGGVSTDSKLVEKGALRPDRSLPALDWISVYALAVNEENAGGGRVVTAPTNGAAGIIPAVLKYYLEFICPTPGQRNHDTIEFLLTAAAIGMLFKRGASISAAEMGCQGEVGVACSMAAAGFAAVCGGTVHQIENAAEIGMEHNLGLSCDPPSGLVVIPCIERNALGAIKAISAAQLALNGDGTHRVSLDQCIETMRQTGVDMSSKYKETSAGGLAVNVPVC